MADRPILFSAPMVRALLAGTKTQTRRPVKPQPDYICQDGTPARSTDTAKVRRGQMMTIPCPYGQPGDRLWVRESHWWFRDEHDPVIGYFPPKLTADDVKYRADGEVQGRTWRPSIHMPRWASRITLEVTTVRVERLQDISEADSVAEGIESAYGEWRDYRTDPAINYPVCLTPCASYQTLWESINGPGSWEANPWVWVVSFKRVTS